MFIGLRSASMSAPSLDIRPLTPDRLLDLASLFEQGGDPKWCWCAYFRIRGFDFSKGSEGASSRRDGSGDTCFRERGPCAGARGL